MSYGHIDKLEPQLRQEVQQLLMQAEQADQSAVPDGMELPEEIARRETRLSALAQARTKIEVRAKDRYARELADYQDKLARREEKARISGKKPGGKPPAPPAAGPTNKDQINLTDEESCIMPTSGGGFEQAYNAQAAVDTNSMLIVAPAVTPACNDREQVKPMLNQLTQLPAALGKIEHLLTDNGFYSAANAAACETHSIEPLMAVGRESHHPSPFERFTESPALPDNASPAQRMAHKLKSQAGRKLYALRKQTVEPVFGIIKSVMGFRQFLLRGLGKVKGEWTLVCLVWNLKRMASLRLQMGN